MERLLTRGEPLPEVVPHLITCRLNAHEALLEKDAQRIEALLQQLQQAGHTALATLLRKKLTAKLAAWQPKKPWWKFGR